VDTAAKIYAGDIAGGLIEQNVAIELRQIDEWLGCGVPSPWSLQRADAAGEQRRSGELHK
jgi:hypothetical protein